jgi:hypothetical protein
MPFSDALLSRPSSALARRWLAFGSLAVASVLALSAHAIPLAGQESASATQIRAAEQGPRWATLLPAHRVALKPLEHDWSTFGADQKQKWIELAAQFPSLSADERQRVQTRMTEWAKLTPDQRGAARFQFKQAKELAPTNRQARWDAYQALPDDQKKELASRAAPPQAQTESARRTRALRAESASQPGAQSKSNVVSTESGRQPRSVAPAVVQAPAGATTNLISKRATPPAHQQEGLPKITASPNFVNPATLLPKSGPQGAAVVTPGASAPATRP